MADRETWEPVPSQAPLGPGTYRIVGAFKGAYNPATREGLKRGLQLKLEAAGNRFLYFLHAPPVMSAHDAKLGPWPFTIAFERPRDQIAVAGFDGRAVLGLLALIAGAALALSIVAARLEKLVTAIGREVIQPTLKPLLSPGTIVLAALGVFLFLQARRVSS